MELISETLGQMTPQTQGEDIVDLKRRIFMLENLIPQMATQLSSVKTFMDKHEEHEETMEEIQRQRHQENAQHLTEISNRIANKTYLSSVVQVLIAIAALAVAVFFGVVTVRAALRSNFDPQHLFSHTPMVAETTR